MYSFGMLILAVYLSLLGRSAGGDQILLAIRFWLPGRLVASLSKLQSKLPKNHELKLKAGTLWRGAQSDRADNDKRYRSGWK